MSERIRELEKWIKKTRYANNFREEHNIFRARLDERKKAEEEIFNRIYQLPTMKLGCRDKNMWWKKLIYELEELKSNNKNLDSCGDNKQ